LGAPPLGADSHSHCCHIHPGDKRGSVENKGKGILIQSNSKPYKLWYLTLKRLFIDDGFMCSSNDECVFINIVVAVYVDIIVQSDREDLINGVIELLKSSFHEIKVNRGKTHQYLGMMFDYTNSGKVLIKMTGYINDLVEKLGVSSIASTLANRDLFMVDETEPMLNEQGQKVINCLCLH
jgi:hypothetical protein